MLHATCCANVPSCNHRFNLYKLCLSRINYSKKKIIKDIYLENSYFQKSFIFIYTPLTIRVKFHWNYLSGFLEQIHHKRKATLIEA